MKSNNGETHYYLCDNLIMITSKTTISEIKIILDKESNLLMYAEPDWFDRNGSIDADGLKKKHPNWQVKEMYESLNKLLNIKHEYIYIDAYRGMIIMRQNDDAENIVLLAGGGYGCVCTWAESLPLAIDAYDKGMNVYMLTYSVSEKDLFPRPVEDVAKMLNILIEKYHLHSYIIGGFSAGAHLSAWWSLKNEGYGKYGLLKPDTQILVYPLILIDDSDDDKNLEDLITERIGGNRKHYNVNEHITDDYPKTYIVRGKDDQTLNQKHSRMLINAFEENNVSYMLDEYEHADHGFANGGDTDARGWFDKALEFLHRK